jgi:hypothetical protein
MFDTLSCMVCSGSINNLGSCTNRGSCAADDLALAYVRAAARDKPVAWVKLLAAHDGRFLGGCPGSAQVDRREPCDRGESCESTEERRALLEWEGRDRRGSTLPWLTFQAAHGNRVHHTFQTAMGDPGGTRANQRDRPAPPPDVT